jgi:2-aminobenzoate-CoA ligase
LYPGFSGCSVSLVDRFAPEIMFEMVEKHKITVLLCVPTAFRMMLGVMDAEKKYDLSSLRLCQSAGEALPGDTSREWRRRFGVPILDSVGCGELAYWLSTTETTPDDKLDSSGKPIPGVEVRIVDNSFKAVPKGTEGEMLVLGPLGTQYWRRPDKQKLAIVDGWSRTGLIYREDEDGYFWYRGRDDDMIVSSGYKIPPEEVELALARHPSVQDCAVVDASDPVRGTIVKAFIVLKPGYSGSDALADEIKNFVKEKIEMYKYPREIEFITQKEMPRGITGKIQRFALRDREKEKSKK